MLSREWLPDPPARTRPPANTATTTTKPRTAAQSDHQLRTASRLTGYPALTDAVPDREARASQRRIGRVERIALSRRGEQ